MSEPFTIRHLRAELGLTLAQLGEKVGVRSVGHMSDIERGEPCSVRVALAIEALSEGRIAASTLSADVALVEAARDHAASDTADTVPSSPGKGDDVSAQVAA